jgi:hypothetical protein
MANSLWPNLSGMTPPRGMREMLQDAAGDIDAQTKGAVQFYVDTVGVGPSGVIRDLRHNCYLRVSKTNYMHLLFRVTTPVSSPWPAVVTTPEGETFEDIKDESQLRDAIQQVLQRERTKEVVLYLLSTVQ